MVINRLVELPLSTFLAASGMAGCGEVHRIFAGGAQYIPPSARGRVNSEALAELRKLGLAHGERLGAEFERTLQVLGKPRIEYFAHVRSGDHHFGVLVAGIGDDAVIGLCEQRQVWLKPVKENCYLAVALTEHLPEFPAAEFAPFSVARRDLDSASGDVDLFDDGPSSGDRAAAGLKNILTPPFYGHGYLHVASTPDGGTREQTTQAVTYVDVEAGRVGVEVSGPPNNQYINVVPGEPVKLASKLARLRRTID